MPQTQHIFLVAFSNLEPSKKARDFLQRLNGFELYPSVWLVRSNAPSVTFFQSVSDNVEDSDGVYVAAVLQGLPHAHILRYPDLEDWFQQ
jgi:hypothetical protein